MGKLIKIETRTDFLEGSVVVKKKGRWFWKTMAEFSIYVYGLDKAFRMAKQVKKELEGK